MKKTTSLALATSVAAAMIALPGVASADTTVTNVNTGSVFNYTGSSANTGGNTAKGSHSGDGGNGGGAAVTNTSGTVNGVDGGNAGDGGNSGYGGYVNTGNAVSSAGTFNQVNTNDTLVDNCDCEGNTDVTNVNEHGTVWNGTKSSANSGRNTAYGSYAGSGGQGGGASALNTSGNAKNIDGGNGADGGASSRGGRIYTGNARSSAGTDNIVNTNITTVGSSVTRTVSGS